ncbi:hypothetical protein [Petrimonas sp.]|uniref:hypothetical protein n=1 Tax=Petrimonas sp. TaxID=2023866 RepID=UPI0030CCFC8E
MSPSSKVEVLPLVATRVIAPMWVLTVMYSGLPTGCTCSLSLLQPVSATAANVTARRMFFFIVILK